MRDTFVLNDGYEFPTKAFGTYKLGVIPAKSSGQNGVATYLEQDVTAIIKQAADAGFRSFDCASFYENEALVGVGLKNCGVPRSELYIGSKVWSAAIDSGPDAVYAQCMQTLQDLQIDYLDLYLIHWPVPTKHVAAYQCLERLKQEGFVRSIGVSNYTIEDFEELLESCQVVPAVNQLEVNPFLFRSTTIEYFQNKGCLIQGYRCLANGKFSVPLVLDLAAKHNVFPSAILVGFLLQSGVGFLGKSSKRERIQENFCSESSTFQLTLDEMNELKSLTTAIKKEEFVALYRICCIRDTHVSEDLVKAHVTCD